MIENTAVWSSFCAVFSLLRNYPWLTVSARVQHLCQSTFVFLLYKKKRKQSKTGIVFQKCCTIEKPKNDIWNDHSYFRVRVVNLNLSLCVARYLTSMHSSFEQSHQPHHHHPLHHHHSHSQEHYHSHQESSCLPLNILTKPNTQISKQMLKPPKIVITNIDEDPAIKRQRRRRKIAEYVGMLGLFAFLFFVLFKK